jgi:hypothetical protein
MLINGFIEMLPGIWYEEATGLPWSNKKNIGHGQGAGSHVEFIEKLHRIHSNNKYKASIHVNGKTMYLGYYCNSQDAYEAYLQAKVKYHGIDSIKPLGDIQ